MAADNLLVDIFEILFYGSLAPSLKKYYPSFTHQLKAYSSHNRIIDLVIANSKIAV